MWISYIEENFLSMKNIFIWNKKVSNISRLIIKEREGIYFFFIFVDIGIIRDNERGVF